MVVLLGAADAAAEEWIGLDERAPIIVGFDVGEDEAGDSNRALTLDLPLDQRAGVYGYYGETVYSDFDEEFESLALMTTVWFEVSTLINIELQHFFEGNEDELEKESFGLALHIDRGEWNFRVQLDEGEVVFFTRSDLGQLLDRVIPDDFDSDLSAFSLSLGRNLEQWYWQAHYQDYDYDRDLSVLANSRFALLIAKPSTLAHSSFLIDESVSLVVGGGDYDRDLSLQLTQERSALDDVYDEYVVLAWQHWPSDGFGYLLAASTPLPLDNDVGLTLGLRWSL